MILSGAIAPGQSRPESDGNEGKHRILPKLQYYWNFSMRLFSFISRTLVGCGCLTKSREGIGTFFCPANRAVYIYIYSHPQTGCFVLSELSSVAIHVGHSKPGSKPIRLYVRLTLRPLGQQAYHVG